MRPVSFRNLGSCEKRPAFVGWYGCCHVRPDRVLTVNEPVSYLSARAMRIRPTSLVLILMLGGSAFGRVPLQFGQRSCGMDQAMGDMDCCKLALMPDESAEAATARLCCALNCAEQGTTPVSEVRFAPQLQLTVLKYPESPEPLATSPLMKQLFGSAHGPPGESPPAYIRNLTLLI